MLERSGFGERILNGRQTYQQRVSHGRKKLSIADLWAQCKDHSPHLFTASDLKTGSDLIRAFEQNKRVPSPAQCRVIEAVLHLEQGELEQDTTRAPTQRTAQRRYMPLVKGMREVASSGSASQFTSELLDQISRGTRNIGFAGPRLVLLHGQPGYGKSYRIAQWWWRSGHLSFRSAMLYLDASRAPGDQLIRNINAYFGLAGEVVGPELAARIRAAGYPLIILDGLSLEASGSTMHPTQADSESWRSVRELIALLAREQVPAAVLLGVQTVRGADSAWRQLAGTMLAEMEAIEVQALPEAEGARLLQDLGVSGYTETDLERISRQLMGMPIALEAAARFVVGLADQGDQVALEEFALKSEGRSGEFSKFEEFFDRLIELLERTKNHEAHPHAFMRLLALFPGAAHRTRVELLLRERRIRRLTKLDLPRMLANPPPFVQQSGERVDLHPFARKLLLADLDRILLKEISDESTDKAELQWIHLRMADICISQLPERERDFPSVDLELIEAALHHLLALSRLLPLDAALSTDPATTRMHALIGDQIDTPAILRFCFQQIVSRFLLDRSHHVTRFLGHYETKARLLSYMTTSWRGEELPAALSKDNAQLLFQEMGMCWMHGGRLKLATDAIAKALNATAPPSRDTKAYVDQIMDPDDLHEELRRRWIQYAELASTSALILMRQGRILHDVHDVLASAESVAMEIESRVTLKKTTKPTDVIRAARRILSRSAHLSLAAGKVEEAIGRFQRSTEIERTIGNPFLSGDACRRYVEALIRSRQEDHTAIARARELVTANLEWSEKQSSRRRRASNDIVALLLSDAIVSRVERDLNVARAKLDAISAHPFVLSGECPYAALQEIRLETLRLRIALGGDGELANDLQVLIRHLADTHHEFYRREALLLQAEIEPSQRVRNEILNDVGTHGKLSGWRRWSADVELLRDGGSVVQQIGI